MPEFTRAFGSSGGVAARALLAKGAASPSTLATLGEFLSRPLWAGTSLLARDVEGFGRNIAQMALDIPTGGFLNRDWSLANVFTDEGTLTDEKQQREVSDVLRGYGINPGRGWEKTAVDVLGGMALDPLTYLTLGGGGIAKSAFSGLKGFPAASKLARMMSEVPGGVKALKRFGGTGKGIGEADLSAAMRAMEDVLPTFHQPGGASHLWSGVETVGPLLDEGLEALEAAGQLETRGGLRVGLPFMRGKDTGIGRDLWKKVGQYGTAPGWAMTVGRHVAPGPTAAAETVALDALNRIKTTFVDKTGSLRVPAGMPHVMRKATRALTQKQIEDAELTEALWAVLPEDHRKLLAKEFAEAGDAYHASIGALDEAGTAAAEAWGTAYRAKAAGKEGAEQVKLAKDAVKTADERLASALGTPGEAAARGERQAARENMFRLERSVRAGTPGAPLTAPDAPIDPVALQASLDDGMFARLEAAGVNPTHARAAVTGYRKAMGEIPDELVTEGIWKEARPDPYYLPHQQTLDRARGRVFEKGRKHETWDEYQGRLDELGVEGEIVGGAKVLGEVDMGALMHHRLLAHHKTLFRHGVERAAESRFGMTKAFDPKTGKQAWEQSNVRTYLDAHFAPLPERGVTKILGGGKFRIPLAKASDALKTFAKRKGARVVTKGGEQYLEYDSRGLNWLFKPMLTSHPQNPSFHIRNTVSAMIMGMFDEDIGFRGVRAIASSLRNLPGVKNLVGFSGNETATFVRALDGDAAAIAAVAALPDIGSYTATEVLAQTKGFLGRRISQSDLMESIGRIDPLNPRKEGMVGKAYSKWTGVGEDIANAVESSFRLDSYLTLIRKGFDPTEAVQKVERAFVDYKVNSVAERAVRDVIPFAKFAIASTQWIPEFAKRPRLLTPLTRTQASAREDGAILPEAVREGVGIPLGGGQFLTGLGLPQEAAINALSAVTSTTGARRQIGGGLHPLLKLPLEKAMNRSMYFGSEFGAYRKAPALARGLGISNAVKTPWGTQHEVSGTLNAVLNALPTSRAQGAIDKLFDKDRERWNTVMNVLTGARSMTVHEEREIKKAMKRYLQDKVDSGQVGEVVHWYPRMDPGEMPEDLKIVLMEAKRQGAEASKRAKKRRALFRFGGL